MTQSSLPKTLTHLPNFTARKVQAIPGGLASDVPDSLPAWATRYLALAVVGVRSAEVTSKIALHLDRFVSFFVEKVRHLHQLEVEAEDVAVAEHEEDEEKDGKGIHGRVLHHEQSNGRAAPAASAAGWRARGWGFCSHLHAPHATRRSGARG